MNLPAPELARTEFERQREAARQIADTIALVSPGTAQQFDAVELRETCRAFLTRLEIVAQRSDTAGNVGDETVEASP